MGVELPSSGGGGGISQATADATYVKQTAGTINMGSGTGTATVGGLYAKFVSGAGVGNAADTTDDTLWALTAVPANSFTANGDTLFFRLSVTAANTANNKRFGITVAATQINTNIVAQNNTQGIMFIQIARVDSTHVNVIIGGQLGTSNLFGMSTNLAVADLTSNTLALTITGASPTTGAASDVKLYSGIAEWIK